MGATGLLPHNDLSDVDSAATARVNLGVDPTALSTIFSRLNHEHAAVDVNVVIDGNSNVSGELNDYQDFLEAEMEASPAVATLTLRTAAESGHKWTDAIAHFSTEVEPYYNPNAINFHTMELGSNDFYIGPLRTLAQAQNDALTLVAMSQAAGFIPVLCTLTARNPSFTNYFLYLPNRLAFNQWLRDEVAPGGLFDGCLLSDLAADPDFEFVVGSAPFEYNGLGEAPYDGDIDSGYYQADKTHWNNSLGAPAAAAIDAAAMLAALPTVISATPDAHAASHEDGGSDELELATSQVTGLDTALTAKAPIASPTFTGEVTTPLLTIPGSNANIVGLGTGTTCHIGIDSSGNFYVVNSSGATYRGFRGKHVTFNDLVMLDGVSSNVARVRNTANNAYASLEMLNLTASGAQVTLSALPTSDPAVAGRLWRSGNDLKVSTG